MFMGVTPLSMCGWLLIFVVDIPHALLNQPLHHGVERDPALRLARDSCNRRRLSPYLHLLLGVALGDLLAGGGIQELVAHADDPYAGRRGGIDRARDRARRGTAAVVAEQADEG